MIAEGNREAARSVIEVIQVPCYAEKTGAHCVSGGCRRQPERFYN